MDIILGSMNFKLNGFNELKDPETGKRSKRTIAKDKLYKVINANIREIRKGFNVGVSTGIDGDTTNIKITGQWLKNLGFNIGDKLDFSLENGKIILSKLSLQKRKELDIQLKSKQLEKQLQQLKK